MERAKLFSSHSHVMRWTKLFSSHSHVMILVSQHSRIVITKLWFPGPLRVSEMFGGGGTGHRKKTYWNTITLAACCGTY
jgi:hypothetical protein